MKVALYARVSSEAQDVELSIAAQLRALRDYAAKNEQQIVYEFIDEAESGRTASRPEFKKMIALAKSNTSPFEAILVWKLNRFARNRVDSITYKTLLQKKGIKVISINEPLDDTPTGKLMEGIIESLDEFYSANLGQDIKRGMKENALRGFFNGSQPPLGYRIIKVKDGPKQRNRLEPESDTSSGIKTVRHIFGLADKGQGCKEIAVTLNREGYRTRAGERWGRTTVHKILTNEAYIGTLVWGARAGRPASKNGEGVKLGNAFPGIIDKEVFQRVQQNMTARQPGNIHPRTIPSQYLLSGLAFCGCGASLTGHSAKSGRHFYYQCNRKFKQGNEVCNGQAIPKSKLESAVITQIKSRILTEENLENLVSLVNKDLELASVQYNERLAVIDTELEDIRQRLNRLYEAIESGKLDYSDLSPRIKDLRSRQSDLEKSMIVAEAELLASGSESIKIEQVKAYAGDLKQLLAEAEISECKAFLKTFVKKIEINGNEATLKYRLPLPGLKNGKEVLPIETLGGAGGIRTLYLLTASYGSSKQPMH
ncbi:recombinase family protein [Dehalococcoides mccartyi]|uniref:recombinase family protein n=1 Tax=Dehalococcoides mccartyi TaxID=61435 RepID=UPI000870E036|nr:recombinase family protein [Dehalococcoides mccartyi]AOV98748.1 resolvase domain protein [Dehalococcoides mccartyi]